MNSSSSNIIRFFLCLVILTALVLPSVHQYKYSFYEPTPLEGAIVEKAMPHFSWCSWFEGKYQDSAQQYLNENFGFRSDFIRANNQVQFSLFNRIKANSVISGKENYLFEENYIKATLGLDFLGVPAIDSIADELKHAAQFLATDSTQLVIVFAPGKGTYCEEYFPEYYLKHRKEDTNYEYLVKALHKKNLNVIDFQDWFLKMKDTASAPLFPKCGIHWSQWGQFIVADSLINYFENTTGKSLPHFVLDSTTVSEENLYTDYDIARGLNLLYPVKAFPMQYPHWHIEPRTSSDSVRVLAIADSYWWGLFNIGVSRDLLGNGQFWFYNEQIFPDSYEKPLFVQDINYINELKKYDVVMLLFTDANLSRFPYGFGEKILSPEH